MLEEDKSYIMPYLVRKVVSLENWRYNAYRPAGSDNRWTYFRVLTKKDIEKKSGHPVYVAVNSKGEYKKVENNDQIIRRRKVEYALIDSAGQDTIKDFPILKQIPKNVMSNAEERGYIPYWAGTFESIDYYYYCNPNAGHYSGLPVIVK